MSNHPPHHPPHHPHRIDTLGDDTAIDTAISNNELPKQHLSPIQSNQSAREQLIGQIKLQLGEPEIDVELTYDQYNYAVTKAFDRYRQRSVNAVEESYVFLEAQPEQTTYILPEEIIEVRTLFRRGAGVSAGGTGSQIDPFSLSITNNYVIKPGGGGGGLALYEMFTEYTRLVGLMFGLYMNYSWDPSSRKLTLMRRITAPEAFLMWVYNYKPDGLLWRDTYARPWIRDYSVAVCKQILGDMRSKFASLPGPQGGVTLNGESLKQEAVAEFERLENEVKSGHDSGMGYTLIFGTWAIPTIIAIGLAIWTLLGSSGLSA